MLLKIFDGRNLLLQYAIIIVFSVLVFLLPVQLSENNSFNPLYSLLFSLINGFPIIIRIIFILVYLAIIILTQIIAESFGIIHREKKHFLFLAPLLMFSYEEAWVLSPPFISLMFIMLGTVFVFKTNENEKSIVNMSTAAIIYAVAALFYFPLIFNILTLVIALIIFKQFIVRDAFAVVLSFALPYIYLFVYYFLNDKIVGKWTEFVAQIYEVFSFSYNSISSIIDYYSLFFAAISIFILFSVFIKRRTELIQIRKYYSFLFVAVLFSVVLLFTTSSDSVLVILYFLLALFYAIFFGNKYQGWVFEVVLLVFLGRWFFVVWNILYLS